MIRRIMLLIILTAFMSTFAEVPEAFLTEPPESSITSCTDQPILIQVQCDAGIIEDSIYLNIDGIIYTIDSSVIIFEPVSNIIEFNPSGMAVFDDGVVTVNLLPLYDVYDTAGTSYTWYFFVDATPPVLDNPVPAPNSVVTDLAFDISFVISDEGVVPEAIAGLDTLSVQVEVTNSDGTYNVTAYMSHTGNLFSINTDDAGLSFIDNEQVTIRVRAGDMFAADEFCGPNILDTTWAFTIGETPCKRGPNPITPNGDAYNDSTSFQFPNMRSKNLEQKIFIYDRYEHLVREITVSGEHGWIWNGKDENGETVTQGVYIYLVVVDNEPVRNGTISVAR